LSFLVEPFRAAVLGVVFLFPGAHAFAAGTAYISIIATGQATVTLTGADGASLTHVTTTGDVAMTPTLPGSYRISVTVGGKTTTGNIVIPESGEVRVIFNPNSPTPFESYLPLPTVEVVTVTSQRVEEDLQKIPLAVTVFDRRQLEAKGVVNLQQTSASTPNLWMEKNTGTSSGARAAIRGVGEDESFFTADPAVGIYIDDVPIPRQTGAQFDLYELERVEVLRGPQGTLFGRNASAGAIRLITRQPSSTRWANVDATYGSFARTDARGSFNSPVAETTSVLVSGLFKRHEGYDRNSASGAKVNDQDVMAGRMVIRHLPNRKLSLLATGDFVRERSTPPYAVGFVPQPPFLSPAPPFELIDTGFGVGPTDFSRQLDGDAIVHTLRSDLTSPLNDLNQTGGSLVAGYALDDRTSFKSITSYRHLFNALLADLDGRTGNAFPP